MDLLELHAPVLDVELFKNFNVEINAEINADNHTLKRKCVGLDEGEVVHKKSKKEQTKTLLTDTTNLVLDRHPQKHTKKEKVNRRKSSNQNHGDTCITYHRRPAQEERENCSRTELPKDATAVHNIWTEPAFVEYRRLNQPLYNTILQNGDTFKPPILVDINTCACDVDMRLGGSIFSLPMYKVSGVSAKEEHEKYVLSLFNHPTRLARYIPSLNGKRLGVTDYNNNVAIHLINYFRTFVGIKEMENYLHWANGIVLFDTPITPGTPVKHIGALKDIKSDTGEDLVKLLTYHLQPAERNAETYGDYIYEWTKSQKVLAGLGET